MQDLNLRYDLGSGASKLVSSSPVEMDVYHKIVAQRSGRNGMLQVDGGREIPGVSPGTLKSLNLGTSIYLGGIPETSQRQVAGQKFGCKIGLALVARIVDYVGTEKNFVGCVEVLTISGPDMNKEYNLVYPASDDINTAVNISEFVLFFQAHLHCLSFR
jgi:hypothetical protein